jgi:integrase
VTRTGCRSPSLAAGTVAAFGASTGTTSPPSRPGRRRPCPRKLGRGVAVGLPWVEVDFDAAAATISTQITQVGWEPVEGEPKTPASLATVSIERDVTLPALRAWRKEQLTERVAYGTGWTDTGRVLTHPDGTAYHPAQLTARFERLAYAAGLPPIRLHDLRHCAATLALAGGADITEVSRMMRHASIQITADIYTEVLPELAAEVAAKVVRMVPRRGRGEHVG